MTRVYFSMRFVLEFNFALAWFHFTDARFLFVLGVFTGAGKHYHSSAPRRVLDHNDQVPHYYG